MYPRAGQPATPADLTDIPALLRAYSARTPDPTRAEERVSFGTSGHRGSSLDGSFNEHHILATTQAIVDYRREQGINGPLFLGKDTHALSGPAEASALEVLAGNEIPVRVDAAGGYVPTPAVSFAILEYNRTNNGARADGIVITPSHNPPRDGGFKYNPPHGGPADTDATTWIADRANHYLDEELAGVQRSTSTALVEKHDFCGTYVAALPEVVNLDAIRSAGVRIGADPMGGASVDYWQRIAEVHRLDLTVVNTQVDPAFGFMTLDSDELIRMDCSSPDAMASLVNNREKFDIATGNDADADRHGIVTPDAGLMNPNHFLTVAIDYLFNHRPNWPAGAAIGKTLVSSSIIDRVARSIGRKVLEVPVGFKWFVPGLLEGSVGFGGEESAGASFLRADGSVWSTDKDGIIADVVASEIKAVTGQSPSERYRELADALGEPTYTRIDAPATRERKARLKALGAKDVQVSELAGEKIENVLTAAPGNGAPIGGVKVTTENAWFAARPSGTEEKYKIYAESFIGSEHLERVVEEAQALVDAVAPAE